MYKVGCICPVVIWETRLKFCFIVYSFILLASNAFGSVSTFMCMLITGLSGKSQIMFALVFTTRYLDLFTNFISLYNTTMKVIFITASYATIYLMFVKFKATYDGNHDTFRMEFLLVPVGGLSFLVNHDFSPLEVSLVHSIKFKIVYSTQFAHVLLG